LRASEGEKQKMQTHFDERLVDLDRWCRTNFGEAFSAWIHLKAIRIFVESVLRFSLPVNFEAYILQINKKTEKQLRTSLRQLYAHLGGNRFSSEAGVEEAGAEFYPYVYLSLSF